jgi:hypothetical protein
MGTALPFIAAAADLVTQAPESTGTVRRQTASGMGLTSLLTRPGAPPVAMPNCANAVDAAALWSVFSRRRHPSGGGFTVTLAAARQWVDLVRKAGQSRDAKVPCIRSRSRRACATLQDGPI